MKKRTNGRMVWVVSAALALAMASSRAEDIDLYVSASTASSAPNVLFVIDNTSNWSGNEQAWNRAAVRSKCDTAPPAQREACRGYVDQVFGTDSDLTQGQVQAAALKLVLQELVCGSSARFKGKVKIGFMFLNEAGTVDSPSHISGYIRHRVALLDQVQCDRIVEDLTAIRANPQNPTFKGPSSASYGLALFEAFKYFGGWTNQAGAISGTAGSPAGPRGFGPERNSLKTDREDPLAFTDNTKSTYLSPITDTCSDSYLVFVGNTFPNLEPTGTSIRAKGTPTETYLNTLEGRPSDAPSDTAGQAGNSSVWR